MQSARGGQVSMDGMLEPDFSGRFAQAGLAALGLPQALVWLKPDFIAVDAANNLLCRLRDELRWEPQCLRIYGREVLAPRLSSWIGDPGAVYRYSGARFEPQPWTPSSATLRELLRRELGLDFNSMLANQYRNGHDGMGWHADDEPELGETPVIASLSFGGTRRFSLRHRATCQRVDIELPSGSLLIMAGTTQRHWRHALPKTAKPVAPRINLTFRQIRC